MPGKSLLLWKDLPKDQNALLEQAGIDDQTQVVRENVERLAMGGHAPSSFNSIASGLQAPQTVQHDLDLLSKLASLGSPGAKVTIVQAVTLEEESSDNLVTSQKLVNTLKLAGLVNVAEPVDVALDPEVKSEVKAKLGLTSDAFKVISVACSTPEYEIGSSRLLSFAKNVQKKKADSEVTNGSSQAKKAAVWGLTDLDDDEVDLVDDDQLLDEDDLAKPDPASLRVCGTTGKRKACKDCSCGLAEELDAGKAPTKKTVTSSCGSCYLGDAFRCASCPYLGMPAFKPGEKVSLSQRQLNADA